MSQKTYGVPEMLGETEKLELCNYDSVQEQISFHWKIKAMM